MDNEIARLEAIRLAYAYNGDNCSVDELLNIAKKIEDYILYGKKNE